MRFAERFALCFYFSSHERMNRGDEFQMPDDHRYWAHEMPTEMNLLMVKNAEHSVATGLVEVLQSASAFVSALVANYPRPTYNWTIDDSDAN